MESTGKKRSKLRHNFTLFDLYPLRIDPHWASQTALLPFLAQLTGYKNPPTPVLEPEVSLAWLTAIYDKNLETHLQDIYQQDYLTFGFEAWSTT
ncbi:MAG: hypothetical protein ACPGJK_04330 [Paracoccaceae bacterium]